MPDEFHLRPPLRIPKSQTHPMPNHKARGELDAMYTSRLLKHRLDSGQTFSIIKQVAYASY